MKRKTWSVMKEIIGTAHQHNKLKLPRKFIVDKKYVTQRQKYLKSGDRNS